MYSVDTHMNEMEIQWNATHIRTHMNSTQAPVPRLDRRSIPANKPRAKSKYRTYDGNLLTVYNKIIILVYCTSYVYHIQNTSAYTWHTLGYFPFFVFFFFAKVASVGKTHATKYLHCFRFIMWKAGSPNRVRNVYTHADIFAVCVFGLCKIKKRLDR